MLQEDSNGESSFEIIDKKNQLTSSNTEKTESQSTLSSVSSAYSIPSPSLVNIPSGNLLSNVAPPSSIPDFTLWPSPTSSGTTPSIVPPVTSQAVLTQPQSVVPTSTSISPLPLAGDQFPSTQFSAAIPPSKGVQHGPISQPTVIETEHSSGFMGLFKEAFSSGGVLSKMAEKAKSSVDSIITTLDPQMSEYICIWYDLNILILRDTEKQITVQTFSQPTPIPVEQFLKEIDSERPDINSLSIEEKLATYLQMKSDWQASVSGVTRKEVLLLAGKTLVRIYKNQLSLVK
ncbi:hypothetical protein NQ314_007151 [Rhamnusium bicolor]|uniref:Uncharacterized protein n=1 Tax=Rhamnusium bicolor TaxID=1586634 RepID=A0AAV8YSV9_9CUCU|nr:hypothetical protein NQ314_007151 [Rhamnusium bicolor]